MKPEKVSQELRRVAEKNKNTFTPTFGIRITDMCTDAANTIDSLLVIVNNKVPSTINNRFKDCCHLCNFRQTELLEESLYGEGNSVVMISTSIGCRHEVVCSYYIKEESNGN